MKKIKFLLLALLATISLGAWADVPTNGVYYLKSVTTGKYVSRGSDWNTRAIVDDWGVAVQVTTEGENTTCKFVDSNLNLFATDDGYVFTDNDSKNIQWTLQETTDGFKFKNVNKETYIVLVEANNFMNLHQGQESSAESFTFEPTSEHPAKMAALYEKTKAGVFTAADVDASKLSTDYAAKSITVSDPVSSVAEQYQGCGTIKTQTLSGLKNGLYKVTVNAFHRITGNDATYTAYQGGYASPVVYLFANDMKYQIHSVMDEPATTPWQSGNDYNKDGKYYPNGMTGSANAFNAGKFLNEAWVYVTDGSLTFGLQNDSKVSNGNWTCYQNFTVTYYTDEVSEEDAEAILESVPTAKMAPSILAALTTAKNNFEANKTIANYNALTLAISNANVSVAIYAKLKDAIDLAKELYNKNATGENDFNKAISTAESEYNKTDEDIDVDATVATLKSAINTYLEGNTTNIVVNGTFDSDHNGWASTTGASGQNLANNKTGDFTGYFWENWNGSPKTGMMYQTNASALPKGHYALKIAAFGDQNPANEGSNLFVFVNDHKQRVVSDNPTYYYVPFTLTETAAAGTIKYGLVAEEGIESKWLGIDNVSICFLDGMSNLYATEEDYKALESALSVVSDKEFGFEAGEYAPYNNVEVAKAIAIAKAIDPTVNNIAADVRTATNALTNAVWVANETEVNAVYDGSFNLTTKTEIVNGNPHTVPTGWTNLGYNTRVYNESNMGTNYGVNATSKKATMFAKFTTEYGIEAGYTMPLKKGVYSLKFIYGGWNEIGTRVIKVYNVSNDATVTPNEVTAKDNQAHVSTDSWSTYSGLIEIPTDGEYILSFYRENTTNQNQIAISDIELKKAATANMTITDAKWGTFFAPFDVTLPEGAFAYTITVEDNKTVRNKVAEGGETIPANTAVLVYSATTINQNFAGAPTDVVPDLANALVGTLEPIASGAAPAGAYYLAKKNGELNFYPAGAAKLAANRAYLVVPAGAKVEGLFDEVVTGINEVNAKNADSILRNIQGMPVSKGYKGIVIENGKKYIKK